jgi:hypothetical protein
MAFYNQNQSYYNTRSSIPSPIETDNIINNINFNIKKMKNIFRIYVDKYKQFEDNKYLNNQYINTLDANDKNKLISNLINFNRQLTAFIKLNSQSLINQNSSYPQISAPIMIQPQQQSYFYGGKKSKKSNYIKTSSYHKIGTKKYCIYLGSRGAKYIKKDKKYINIKTL